MKTRRRPTSAPTLRARKLAVVLSAVGLACLPVRAQESGNAIAADADGAQIRGKMVDRSRTLLEPVAPNTEIQSSQFGQLPPSALTDGEKRVMLETVAPESEAQGKLKIEDEVAGSYFASGRAVLTPRTVAALNGLVASLQGKRDIHIEIIGHTDNQRIAASLRPTFADNQALSEARSLAVAQFLRQGLQLPAEAFSVSGRGESQPVASNNTPEGMAKNRRVELRVWYREAPVAVTREKLVDHNACVANPAATEMPFSITVDGHPVELDNQAQEADRQRCVDVALEKADIQIKFDPLNTVPALNIWVAPSTAVRGRPIYFGTYTNYVWWQKKAELRVFAKGQSAQQTPFAVVPFAPGEAVQWQAPDNAPDELVYLMRVYDKNGQFDETLVKPLRLAERADALSNAERQQREKLAGWGESGLNLKNIPARGGSVSISGEHVKNGDSISAMGMPVPVDEKGKFAMRQILPPGPHQVEVAVRDSDGKAAIFRRNLSIADQDWFYFVVGDLTVGQDRTTGPAQLVTTDTSHYNNETWIDGRGAFYLKGKIKGDYLLTASADTREQPLRDLFSNFQTKDPNYLLRRIDPDRYYPVYGDDSTITDDAPTQGKFYVKLEKDSSYVMWGNFQTAWTGTELTQYSRGLYGANAMWNSKEATRYGEKVTSVNAFVADPGTLQSREEFRGTGGSLYYLHHLDLTEGSERLWVEIRDKDSGLVIQRTPLTPAQDYEINYLQGRLTLRAPLPSVADGSTLVQTSSASGNPVYLVTTYEYVPGLSEISSSAVGLRASHWFNDHLRLGTTIYRQGEGDNQQNLKGIDATFRHTPGTWVKGELARSSGIGSESLSSITGGYDFVANQRTGDGATARRIDAAVDLGDVSEFKGRLTGYWQERDPNFSGPGATLPSGEGLSQKGMSATVPIGDRTEFAAKVDTREQVNSTASQSANSTEAAVRHKIDAEWGVSVGVRHDNRSGINPTGVINNASSLLSQNGARNDVIMRVDYRPLEEGEAEKAVAMEAAQAAAADSGKALVDTVPATNLGTAPPATGSVLLTPSSNGPASSIVPTTGVSASSEVRTSRDATSAAGVAAARVAGLQYKSWDSYAFVQGTVSRSGDRTDNDRIGVGGSWRATDKLRLGAEASGGDGGAGGRLSADYQVDERSTVYLTYTMETESADSNYAGRQATLASGTHYRFNDQVGMFGETRWANGEGPKSLTHAFGVDYAPDNRWTFGGKYETGTLSDPLSGDLKRDAIGLSAAFKYNDLKYASAIEYRMDRGTSLGVVSGTCLTNDTAGNCGGTAVNNNRRTWLWKNQAQYQLSPAWRLLGKFNLSRSSNTQGAFYDGDYTETVLGAAYRPIDNDRWNTLFKYTYFYNVPSAGQVDGGAYTTSSTGGALDYAQKSHVFNIDTTYDVLPWLSVGVKYGMRLGQLRMSKTEGEWFSSRADLWVLRADLHLVKEWDALVEARRLRAKEAGDARSGFLAGVYRHVNEHVKMGVGYNFTDFSDNLTDMSYRSRGWFLNALATF
ncbi:OmpA family protein [Herbaspirillum chlorophenolicum]|uniref:OmpA family protein n=1 Tax=Herbaspirillum chlorophenolicum TaxID=211589 RepID=UPI0009E327CD|nr:OmpA family protein [Herbaspirillum chlorophenolicum]